MVVKVTAEGIQVSIDALINGAAYVWQGLVSLVEQAFDIVEGLFETIGVGFQTLFQWLGFIFDWQHILLSQSAIEYMIGQGIDMLSGMVGWLQGQVDSQIATWESDIENWAASFGPPNSSSTVLSLQSSSPPAPDSYLFATSHNLALNGLADNYQRITVNAPSAPGSSAGDPSPIGVFIDNLIQNFQNIDVGTAQQNIENAISAIQALATGNVSTVYQTAMSAFANMVAAIAQVGLELGKFIVDTIAAALDALISAFKGMLNAQWNIPIVSSLYRYATKSDSNPEGSPLTAAGLIALVAAIPSTVLYKIVTGNAPYETQADVDAFESQYDAQTLLTGMGITTGAGSLPASPAALPPTVQFWMAMIGAMSSLTVGMTSAFIDSEPVDSVPLPGEELVSGLNVICEFLCAFTGAPFWAEFNWWEVVAWSFRLVSSGLDLGYLVFKQKLPESFNQ